MGFNCIICHEREVWIREAAYMFPGSQAYRICSDCFWDTYATDEQKKICVQTYPLIHLGKNNQNNNDAPSLIVHGPL